MDLNTVCCWSVCRPSPEGTTLTLVARGSVKYNWRSDVVRIGHRGSFETGDLSLLIESHSGEQFSAHWKDPAVALSGSPEELHFVEEGEQSPLKNTRVPLLHNETRCYQSGDWVWALDDKGKKLLWIPPAIRGNARWHGQKLLIGGDIGRLTLIDFSDTKIDSDSTF